MPRVANVVVDGVSQRRTGGLKVKQEAENENEEAVTSLGDIDRKGK